MTQDYPDWTRLIQLIGADIMMPIDIQGAYIMMPVDIQAQYITLDIDIVAQTVGNIGIDIKAQTLGNIDIDIKAQTVGNLVIDIEAQSVGIYLKADWEVLQGTDKNLTGSVEIADADQATVIDYTVTDTLYICQWGFNVVAGAGVIGFLYSVHNAAETRVAASGGYSGNGHNLSKPIAIIAGDHIKLYVRQYSGATNYVSGHVGGYEI